MVSDLQIRPATMEDLTAVSQIVSAQVSQDYEGITFTASELAERWQRFDLMHDTWVALAETKIIAYLDLDRTGSVPLLFLADPTVPEIGLQLLRVAEKSVTISGTLVAQVSEKNEVLQQIYAKAGYQHGLTFYSMAVEMDELPTLQTLPDGFEIRPFDPTQDTYTTYLADEEASQDKGYHTPLSFDAWRKRMGMENEKFDPTLWFLAWIGEELAGVCLNFYSEAWQAGWIDHLGVKRPYRRQGLGKALLLHSFAQFYQHGIHKIMLNVDSGSLTNAPRLYESVGMKMIGSYLIYQKEVDL